MYQVLLVITRVSASSAYCVSGIAGDYTSVSHQCLLCIRYCWWLRECQPAVPTVYQVLLVITWVSASSAYCVSGIAGDYTSVSQQCLLCIRYCWWLRECQPAVPTVYQVLLVITWVSASSAYCVSGIAGDYVSVSHQCLLCIRYCWWLHECQPAVPTVYQVLLVITRVSASSAYCVSGIAGDYTSVSQQCLLCIRYCWWLHECQPAVPTVYQVLLVITRVSASSAYCVSGIAGDYTSVSQQCLLWIRYCWWLHECQPAVPTVYQVLLVITWVSASSAYCVSGIAGDYVSVSQQCLLCIRYCWWLRECQPAVPTVYQVLLVITRVSASSAYCVSGIAGDYTSVSQQCLLCIRYCWWLRECQPAVPTVYQVLLVITRVSASSAYCVSGIAGDYTSVSQQCLLCIRYCWWLRECQPAVPTVYQVLLVITWVSASSAYCVSGIASDYVSVSQQCLLCIRYCWWLHECQPAVPTVYQVLLVITRVSASSAYCVSGIAGDYTSVSQQCLLCIRYCWWLRECQPAVPTVYQVLLVITWVSASSVYCVSGIAGDYTSVSQQCLLCIRYCWWLHECQPAVPTVNQVLLVITRVSASSAYCVSGIAGDYTSVSQQCLLWIRYCWWLHECQPAVPTVYQVLLVITRVSASSAYCVSGIAGDYVSVNQQCLLCIRYCWWLHECQPAVPTVYQVLLVITWVSTSSAYCVSGIAGDYVSVSQQCLLCVRYCWWLRECQPAVPTVYQVLLVITWVSASSAYCVSGIAGDYVSVSQQCLLCVRYCWWLRECQPAVPTGGLLCKTLNFKLSEWNHPSDLWLSQGQLTIIGIAFTYGPCWVMHCVLKFRTLVCSIYAQNLHTK